MFVGLAIILGQLIWLCAILVQVIINGAVEIIGRLFR